MNTKKIAISLIASALLTTAAFAATPVGTAGKLTENSTVASVTIEYNDKYGSSQIKPTIGSIIYTADILGSGSVSDALIRLDMTDTNIKTAAQAGFVSGKTAIINNETNVTIATYDKQISSGGRSYFLFDGDATKSIVDGAKYRFVVGNANDDDTTAIPTEYSYVNGGAKLYLDVYSTSGSEELRDKVETNPVISNKVAQFSTSCITKFDGLINIENFQDSFVSTSHDNLATDFNDGLSQQDAIVFTVENKKQAKSLDGNASAIFMQTRNASGSVNVANDFDNTAIWNGEVVAVQSNGTTNTYPLTPLTNVTTKAALTTPTPALTATEGKLHYTTDGNLTFILPNRAIPSGTTNYYFNLTHTTDKGAIKPVNFVNGRFLVEAGLADNNNSIYPAGDTPRGAAQDAGKWVDHAYMAQIPAGESGGASGMLTRYFITNRSCAAVTPQIDVVYNGNVYSAKNVASLAVDTQGVYSLKDIMLSIPELATVWNANTSTKVSVEITLPGIAENFYIYAQVKNKSINQFKDLPVYNTSNRD